MNDSKYNYYNQQSWLKKEDLKFLAGVDSVHDFNDSRIQTNDNPDWMREHTLKYLVLNLYKLSGDSIPGGKQDFNTLLSSWLKTSFNKNKSVTPSNVEAQTIDYLEQVYSEDLYNDKRLQITYRNIIDDFNSVKKSSGLTSNQEILKKVMEKYKKYNILEINVDSKSGESVYWNSFSEVERKHIGIFILNFYMLNASGEANLNYITPSYLSFDAGATVLTKRVFTGMDQVKNLVTPLNLADSATVNTQLLVGDEKKAYKSVKGPDKFVYYFPDHGENKYNYTSNVMTYPDTKMWLTTNPNIDINTYNHENRYQFTLNVQNKNTKKPVEVNFNKGGSGPSVLYLATLVSNDHATGTDKKNYENPVSGTDVISIKNSAVTSQKELYSALIDLKRTGDWEQCNACHHANTTKFKTRCIMSTLDRLCAFYSRVIRQNTIYNQADNLKLFRFSQNLSPEELRTAQIQDIKSKMATNIENIEAINSPFKDYFDKIKTRFVKMTESIEGDTGKLSTPPTGKTIEIDTLINEISEILYVQTYHELKKDYEEFQQNYKTMINIRKIIYEGTMLKDQKTFPTTFPPKFESWNTPQNKNILYYCYNVPDGNAQTQKYLKNFYDAYFLKDYKYVLGFLSHYTDKFTSITNLGNSLSLTNKFTEGRGETIPAIEFGSYSFVEMESLKKKLVNLKTFIPDGRRNTDKNIFVDVLNDDFFKTIKKISESIKIDSELSTTGHDDIKKEITIDDIINEIPEKPELPPPPSGPPSPLPSDPPSPPPSDPPSFSKGVLKMLEENQEKYSTIINATRPTRSSTPRLHRQISRSFSRTRSQHGGGGSKTNLKQKLMDVYEYYTGRVGNQSFVEEYKGNMVDFNKDVQNDLHVLLYGTGQSGGQIGGTGDDDKLIDTIDQSIVNENVGLLDFQIFSNFFTKGANIIGDYIDSKKDDDKCLKDFKKTIISINISDCTGDFKFLLRNNLKYIYDFLPILYVRVFIYSKIIDYIEREVNDDRFDWNYTIEPYREKLSRSQEGNKNKYVTIPQIRKDILDGIDIYVKLKIDEEKEDIEVRKAFTDTSLYELINNFVSKDINFTRDLLMDQNDDHNGYIYVSPTKGFNIPGLSKGLYDLMTSLVCITGLLTIFDFYKVDQTTYPLIGKRDNDNEFAKELYKIYLTNGKSSTTIIDTSIVENMSKIFIDSLGSAKSIITGLIGTLVTSDIDFETLIARIYVFYNDIHIGYLKYLSPKDESKSCFITEDSKSTGGANSIQKGGYKCGMSSPLSNYFTQVHVLGDGNCFYHTLVKAAEKGLLGDANKGKTHVHFRKEIYDYMKNKYDSDLEYQSLINPSQGNNYIDKLQNQGFYAGNFEIAAAEEKYDINIWVYQQQLDNSYRLTISPAFDEHGDIMYPERKKVYIYHCSERSGAKGNHYELLLLKDGKSAPTNEDLQPIAQSIPESRSKKEVGSKTPTIHKQSPKTNIQLKREEASIINKEAIEKATESQIRENILLDRVDDSDIFKNFYTENGQGIRDPITNIYETLEHNPGFKLFKLKDNEYSEGLKFLFRNSFIHIYLLIKHNFENKPEISKDGYVEFIQGGSNDNNIEKTLINLIS